MASEYNQKLAPTRSAIWNDTHYRALFFQALVLALVVAFGVFLVGNALENLERRGIASGFDFLSSTAGFGIIMHLIEYSEESSYGRAFLVGLLNTLLVSSLGIVIATFVGFMIGPVIRETKLLGRESDLGQKLGLSNDWAYHIIKKVGNYGEIYDRNVGPNTPLKLQRGLNQLWNKGGILYAPPMR